jgi:hypothetical protein
LISSERDAVKLPLIQHWLPAPEEGFHEGTASFTHDGEFLILQAELIQPHPQASKATGHGQRLWELGDVVELFLQREGETAYREYQVAPNGKTLSLLYPDSTCVAGVRAGTRLMEEFLTDEIPRHEITLGERGWSVRLEIPIEFPVKDRTGEGFRVSCCRYEHREGLPPVISSTSPHAVRDFHRPQDWREFIPVAG